MLVVMFNGQYSAEQHQLHWICLDIAIENANQINQFDTVGINFKCNKCNNNAIKIPIFRAFLCESISFRFFVIDARATALSADKTSSSDMITGKRGASSTHLSIPSSKGVNDLRDAESIKFKEKNYVYKLLVIC